MTVGFPSPFAGNCAKTPIKDGVSYINLLFGTGQVITSPMQSNALYGTIAAGDPG